MFHSTVAAQDSLASKNTSGKPVEAGISISTFKLSEALGRTNYLVVLKS
jgi:hypothetical protein